MYTKLLLATLAGGVAAFLFGYLFFGILLADFYATNITSYEGLIKNPPNLFMIFVSNLILSFLLAYIFSRWAGIKSAAQGAQAGFIIVGLIAISIDVFQFATMNLISPLFIAVDTVGNAIFGAVVGSVAGFVLGSGKKVVTV
jgi:hypothetical protein